MSLLEFYLLSTFFNISMIFKFDGYYLFECILYLSGKVTAQVLKFVPCTYNARCIIIYILKSIVICVLVSSITL